MIRHFALLAVFLALLGATGFYANSGQASTVAGDTTKDEKPLAPLSLFLVGLGMIAVGVVGKRAIGK